MQILKTRVLSLNAATRSPIIHSETFSSNDFKHPLTIPPQHSEKSGHWQLRLFHDHNFCQLSWFSSRIVNKSNQTSLAVLNVRRFKCNNSWFDWKQYESWYFRCSLHKLCGILILHVTFSLTLSSNLVVVLGGGHSTPRSVARRSSAWFASETQIEQIRSLNTVSKVLPWIKYASESCRTNVQNKPSSWKNALKHNDNDNTFCNCQNIFNQHCYPLILTPSRPVCFIHYCFASYLHNNYFKLNATAFKKQNSSQTFHWQIPKPNERDTWYPCRFLFHNV